MHHKSARYAFGRASGGTDGDNLLDAATADEWCKCIAVDERSAEIIEQRSSDEGKWTAVANTACRLAINVTPLTS